MKKSIFSFTLFVLLAQANVANGNDASAKESFDENKILFFQKNGQKIAVITKSEVAKQQALKLQSEENFHVIDLTKPRSWKTFMSQAYPGGEIILTTLAFDLAFDFAIGKIMTYIINKAFPESAHMQRREASSLWKNIYRLFQAYYIIVTILDLYKWQYSLLSQEGLKEGIALEKQNTLKKPLSKIAFIVNKVDLPIVFPILKTKKVSPYLQPHLF